MDAMDWKQVFEGVGWIMIVAALLFCGYFFRTVVRSLQALGRGPGGRPKEAVAADPPVRRQIDEDLRMHVHENGHVIAAWLDPHVEDIYGVAMLRDGQTLTEVVRDNDVEHPDFPSSTWWYEAVYHLAGLAAEIKVFGDMTKEEIGEETYDLHNARDAIVEGLEHDDHTFDRTPWLDHQVIPGPGSPSLKDCFEESERPPDEVVTILDKAFAHAKSLIASQSDRLRQLTFALKDGGDQLCYGEIESIMGTRGAHTRREDPRPPQETA